MFFAVAAGIRSGEPWAARAGVLAAYAPLLLAARSGDGKLLFGAFAQCTIAAYFFFSAWRGLRAAESTNRPLALAGWLALTASFCGIVWVLAGSMFQMPSESMRPTILAGDKLFTRPVDTLRRGELIIFRPPSDREKVFLMRVVGVPGDRIRIEKKKLLRNGRRIDEPWVLFESQDFEPYRDSFPSEPQVEIYETGRKMLAGHVTNAEVVVPEGHYFVLGDNRDRALDSRYYGFVPAADVLAIPKLILWSDGAQPTDTPFAFYTKARWGRILQPLGINE
jgi:signal peptidase I